jgi:primosomal protein N'
MTQKIQINCHQYTFFFVILESNISTMAKCVQCDYPYATREGCPNCGSKNPSGKSSGTWVVAIIILLLIASQCDK